MVQHKPLVGLERIGPPYFEIHAEGWLLIGLACFVVGIVVKFLVWG